MGKISIVPAIGALEIPVDGWTKPFWEATAEHRLLVPRCCDCAYFRWPPGPFCPHCRSQAIDWVDPGPAQLYSYTVVYEAPASDGGEAPITIPALIEFPEAGGIRLLSALVGAPLAAVKIGAMVLVDWIAAADATVPMFRLPAHDEGIGDD